MAAIAARKGERHLPCIVMVDLSYRWQGCHAIIYPGAFNLTTGPLHWELLQRARYVRAERKIFSIHCAPCVAGPSTTRSLYQCVVLLGTSPPDIMPSASFPIPHRCHIKSVLMVVGTLDGRRSDVSLFPFISVGIRPTMFSLAGDRSSPKLQRMNPYCTQTSVRVSFDIRMLSLTRLSFEDTRVFNDARAGIPVTTQRRFDVYPDVSKDLD